MKALNFFYPLLLALCALTGCGTPLKNNSSSKTLRLNIHREPPTMDPRKGGDLNASVMHFVLFEGLTRITSEGDVALAAASKVSLSKDGKTYTFHIRDCKWSDGSEVTAYDFAYAWKTILSPTFPAFNAHLFYPIKNAEKARIGELPTDSIGISTPDSKTLVIELENPTPYFLDLCAFSVFAPVKENIDQKNTAWAADAGPTFLSNGPFLLKCWNHNNKLSFQKNPHYWEREEIFIDSIEVSMVAEENTVLNMFNNDELDFIGQGFSNVPAASIDFYKKQGKLHVFPCAGSTFVTFNTQAVPFSHPKIRKAFAIAVNRQEIVDHITRLEEDIATTLIPSQLTGGVQSNLVENNNITKAKALFEEGLSELGISIETLPPLTYLYSQSSNHQNIAQALQQQWEKAFGIQIQLKGLEHKVLVDHLSHQNYQFGQSLYIAFYNDPMSILERFKYRSNMKNYPGWENRRYIELLNKASAENDPKNRSSLLKEAETIFAEEMPLSALFHWKTPCVTQKRVLNPEVVSSVGNNFTRLRLADE